MSIDTSAQTIGKTIAQNAGSQKIRDPRSVKAAMLVEVRDYTKSKP